MAESIAAVQTHTHTGVFSDIKVNSNCYKNSNSFSDVFEFNSEILSNTVDINKKHNKYVFCLCRLFAYKYL